MISVPVNSKGEAVDLKDDYRPDAKLASADRDGKIYMDDAHTVDLPADAEGVIIRLKGDSELKIKADLLGKGRPPQEVQDKVAARRTEIAAQHEKVKKDLEQLLSVKLVTDSNKRAAKGQTRVSEQSGILNIIVLSDVPVADTIEKLRGNAEVVSIRPNVTVRPSLLESVPMIKANLVWPVIANSGATLDGTGMKIGVIDTGIDYTHKDFGSCTAIATPSSCKVRGGYDFFNKDADPMDDHGHGTHVSATAAGKGSYTTSAGVTNPLYGVAPGASIYAYKISSSSGNAYSSDIVAAIERCVIDHMDVCTISMGGSGDPDDDMSLAIDTAVNNNIVFTVAAGNTGPISQTINSPGTSRNAVTVAAACKPGQVLGGYCNTTFAPVVSFSSRGPVTWTNALGQPQTINKPDVTAPGVLICAAEWAVYTSGSRCLDGTHIAISGTSMATPHVAGAAALLREAHPELSALQIKDALIKGATNLNVDKSAQGAGMIDINATLGILGLPNSIVKIAGLPIFFDVPATVSMKTFTKNLTLTNSTSTSQTYVPSFTGPAGVKTTFSPSSLTLAPNQSGSVTVTAEINLTIMSSGQNNEGVITFTAGDKTATMNMALNIAPRLVTNPTSLNLGLDDPAQATFAPTAQTVSLTNVLSDLDTTYSVSVAPFTGGGNATSTATNIKATLSASTVSLSKGGSGSLSLGLIATNSGLDNGNYKSTLTITSPLQTIKIPISFYKGYSLKINYGDAAPSDPTRVKIFNNNRSLTEYFYSTNAISDTVYLYYPGPYTVMSQWFGGTSTNEVYMVQHDVPLLGSTAQEVNMGKSETQHTISYNPVLSDGTSHSSISGLDISIHCGERGNYNTYGRNGGSNIVIHVMDFTPASGCTLVTNFNFRAAATNTFYYFDYRLADGVTKDYVLTNTPSQFMDYTVQPFNNLYPDLPVEIKMTDYYSEFTIDPKDSTRVRDFAIHGGSTNSGDYIKWIPGQADSVNLKVYNANPQDLTLSSRPDINSVGFYIGLQTAIDPTKPASITNFVESPRYYLTPSRTFAMSGNLASGYGLDNVPKTNTYSYFKVNSPPAGTLSIGRGPIYDRSYWNNYSNYGTTYGAEYNVLLPYHNPVFSVSGNQLHFWSDGSSSVSGQFVPKLVEKTVVPYSVKLNGTVVKSGTMSGAIQGLRLPLDAGGTYALPGAYQVTTSRNAQYGPSPTVITSVTSFTIKDRVTYATAPIDENPPAISDMDLRDNGVVQNFINKDSAKNTLQFSLDPVPGVVKADPSIVPIRMADAIGGTPTLEQSTDGTNFTPVTLTSGNANAWSGAITTQTSATLYTFRLSAKDSAGNSLVTTFQIPVGGQTTGTPTPTPTPVPETLTASLTGSATTAIVPASVVLTATAGGTATGTLNYTFYCNNPSTSTAVTTPYDAKFDGITSNPKATTCSYTTPGTYTGKVIIERGTAAPVQAQFVFVAKASGDTQAPTVSISSPTTGQSYPRNTSITLAAVADDNVGVTKVEFYVNGSLVGSSTSTTSPYKLFWKIPGSPRATYTITAKAYDQAGNVTTSAPVSIVSVR